MTETAFGDGYRALYHWQAFQPERLRSLLISNSIYCSKPSDFNDPWDCKPHFNTEILEDPVENERHAAWAEDLCRRRNPGMSEDDLANMCQTLHNDCSRGAEIIEEISKSLAFAVAGRYRVYCLAPDAGNLLMWAHYADNHRGVCLEFSLCNDVLCAALRCEYLSTFPVMKAYAQGDEDNLRILLAKADVWAYEREYRLVAQERSEAIAEADTLMTDGGMLKLPPGALSGIIVGCQGDFPAVQAMVAECAPTLKVMRAQRMPNRYEIAISGLEKASAQWSSNRV
jgi:hypothetical protein